MWKMRERKESAEKQNPENWYNFEVTLGWVFPEQFFTVLFSFSL